MSEESFSYISRNGTLHFSAEAGKIKEVDTEKISYTPENGKPQKNYYVSYILGNGTFEFKA